MRPAAVAAALVLALAWPAPVAASETVSRGQADGPRPADAPQPVTVTQRGVASWLVASESTAAAGPALRAFLGPSWRGTLVRVSAGGQSVVVQLSDWCLCIVGGSERLIDLSASAFSRLAPLSAGLVWVEVTVP